MEQHGERAILTAGRSKFTLATLPASQFPTIDDIDLIEKISLSEATLKELMERTSFAMAHQDVRYYLNGLLLDLRKSGLNCVATDGHRLALSGAKLDRPVAEARQIIVPRKGVLELQVYSKPAKARLNLNSDEIIFGCDAKPWFLRPN